MLTIQQKAEKCLKQCLPILQKKYHVRRIGLFGDVIRDQTAKPNVIEILLDDDGHGIGFL
jgi:predicted nucleotidyltransferase